MIVTYEQDFIARVKDLAILGLYPPQIAERLGIVGLERALVLKNITDPDHPLCKEYWKTTQHREEDLDAALQTACMTGDPKALMLAYELNEQKRIDKLKSELFGL